MKQSPYDGRYIAVLFDGGQLSVIFNWIKFRNFTTFVISFEWLNEDTLAIVGYEPVIQIVSIVTGQTLRTINTSQLVSSLKLLSNGIHLASGHGEIWPSNDNYGSISIYNIDNGSLGARLEGHYDSITNLELLSNGTLLASASMDQTVRIWNLTTTTCKFILEGHVGQVYGLIEVASDVIASSSLDTTIRLWNLTTGLEIRSLFGHNGLIYRSIGILGDGQTLVSGSSLGMYGSNDFAWNKNQLKIWNWKSGECLNTITNVTNKTDFFYVGVSSLIVLKPIKGNKLFFFVTVTFKKIICAHTYFIVNIHLKGHVSMRDTFLTRV